jgi:hypothetical protein
MNFFKPNYFTAWGIAASAILITAPALGSHPYAQWADDFGIDLNASYDGTRVMEMKDGTFEFVEHKAPGKMYTEVNMGSMSSVIIVREDLGKGYHLMPGMGMYKETSLADSMSQSSNGMRFHSIEEVGRDEVIGFPSTKYQTRFEDNDGKGAGHFWVTDSGVPIKMDMVYTSNEVQGLRIKMEFIELNMREQDPAIFELPEGLSPMGMSGLGGLFGQGNQPQGDQPAGSALGNLMKQLAPGQQGSGSGTGRGDQPQAGPAGSRGGATSKSGSSSAELTTDNLTQSVQLHLNALGIDPGNTSGEMSVDTQIAISEFQASKGMKVTGEVSPQLLGVLSAEVDSR